MVYFWFALDTYQGGDVFVHEFLGHGYDDLKGVTYSSVARRENTAIRRANLLRESLGMPLRMYR